MHRKSLNAKEVLITQRKGEFVLPVADGSAKIVSNRLRIPGTHFKTGADREERERERESRWRFSRRSGRISTDRIER